MKQPILYISVVLFITASSCSINKQVKNADKRYEIGEYYTAGEIYRKVQPSISNKQQKLRAFLAFRIGECYRLINDNAKASRGYAKAIQYKYSDDIVFLRYAEMLHKNGRYKEAAKNYARYTEKHPESQMAQNGLTACKQMEAWQKEKTRYIVKRADILNSKRNSEFSPAFTGGGAQTVAITSNRDNKLNKKNNAITGQPRNNLFFAKKNATGKWEKPKLSEYFNTADDEGSACFSLTGKIIYFTRCRAEKGKSLGAEIYVSNRSGAQWSTPKKVELFADSSISVAHPALSPDGQYLYFTSDHANGVGGKDLWRSKIDGEKYNTPENLGKTINTDGDEMFPSFDAKGNLYFASNGHPGFGGLDIFCASVDSAGNWIVENMKTPINSNADDFGITFEESAPKGFFSSNRQQPKGYDKIWSFELPQIIYNINGYVKNHNDEMLDATIKLIGDNGTNVKMRTKKDGSYRISLKKNESYIIMATSKGYLNESHQFTTKELTDSKNFTFDFNLVNISKPVQINNIFFEFGKWDLTKDSENSLKNLIQLLNDNPNITIEISAHTDMKGTESFNIELSKKRAQSVVDYLIKSGIEAERLTCKGYGKSKPVVADKALCKKYRFLRENEPLNQNFYDHLTNEQKDIVDKINRRTEFKVTKTTYKLY